MLGFARLPEGWTEKEFADLHPAFAPYLCAAVLAAQDKGIPVRKVSGFRSNIHQKHLRDTYEERLALWQKAGGPATGKPKPLPASPPGQSAHNFTRCVAHPSSHRCIGEDLICPECGGPVVPAALGVDVGIRDPGTNNFLRAGGQVPLAERHPLWQAWAAELDRWPTLRDGGDFKNIDQVHVESIWWDRPSLSFKGPVDPDPEISRP